MDRDQMDRDSNITLVWRISKLYALYPWLSVGPIAFLIVSSISDDSDLDND